MTRGKRKTESNTVNDVEEGEQQPKLAATKELTSEPAKLKNKGHAFDGMTDLDTVLREIKEFRREHTESFKELKDDIKKTNTRVEQAEQRIMESEERIQNIEDATLELLELQKELKMRLIDQESRARRDNIRIHGVKEGSEDGSQSMAVFIESLLKENLDLATLELNIERAHRSVGQRPPNDAPPRSIVVKLLSYKSKEAIITAAWRKKGFEFEGRKVIIDHDYAPEILRQRKAYTEAKKVLKEKKIRFQTPFPAKLRVFYDGETQTYNSAAEATRDMAERGYQVTVLTPAEDLLEKTKRLTWRTGQAVRGHRADARPGYKQKLDAFRRPSPEERQKP
ncbi:hypothetical protein WMY93_033851 [Mugilogobius chulae]|uniref:L1 transposable element RRM domain-containing protein n=1 Tax=Mugilogobius chulae TaxID=88201 RepID=A0AAW0MQQ0_9GOBI